MKGAFAGADGLREGGDAEEAKVHTPPSQLRWQTEIPRSVQKTDISLKGLRIRSSVADITPSCRTAFRRSERRRFAEQAASPSCISRRAWRASAIILLPTVRSRRSCMQGARKRGERSKRRICGTSGTVKCAWNIPPGSRLKRTRCSLSISPTQEIRRRWRSILPQLRAGCSGRSCRRSHKQVYTFSTSASSSGSGAIFCGN